MEHIYKQSQFGEDWFTYPNLYTRFVKTLRNGQKMVEVGSWKGKSTAYLAVEIINSGKNIKVDAVDTWKGSPKENPALMNDAYVKTDTLYNLFLTNMSSLLHVVNPVRAESVVASKMYEDNSVDIVFIDACHHYDCITEDIAAWYPKVKSGGIFAGHDYHFVDSIKRAVDETFGEANIESTELCWVYNKP